MKRIEVSQVMSPEEAKMFKGKFVMAGDMGELLPEAEPFELYDADTGALLALYIQTPTDNKVFRKYVSEIIWGETIRSNDGLLNKSTTFGFSPRLSMRRRESCGAVAMAAKQPEIHQVLVDVADRLTEWLDANKPQIMEDLRATPILNDWRLGSSAWTSGVVNYSSELPYHYDGANFDVWGAMPAVRRGMRGGHLSIPQYGICLPVRDGHTLLFNGRSLLHGVTPIQKISPDGYRITAVYYCLKGMKNCADYARETLLANERRSTLERKPGRTELSLDRYDAPPTIGADHRVKVMRTEGDRVEAKNALKNNADRKQRSPRKPKQS